jgi:hypothetical protein
VFDDMLKKSCLYHKTTVNHTLEQCDMLKKYYSRVAAKEDKVKKEVMLQFRRGDIRCWWHGAGCRRLGVVRRPLQHHASVRPHHQHLERGLRGWPG